MDRDFPAAAADVFLFAFPALELMRVRHGVFHAADPRAHTAPNTFRHMRNLATPTSRNVTTPNNDTLYSAAWLDLRAGPVHLHLPNFAGRYYSVQLMDFYSSVFAIIGRRNAPVGGDYLIVGPGWDGAPRAGETLIVAPTPWVWLLVRIVVDDEDDLTEVRRLQNGLALTPLGTAALPIPNGAVDALREADIDTLTAAMQAIVTENPPLPRDGDIAERITVLAQAENKNAITRGIAEARTRLVRAADNLRRPPAKGVWNVPPQNIGTFDTDYLLRAAVALMGLGALPREEAMYFTTDCDADGTPLDGRNRYELRFAKDALPPAHAFWSLTLYELDCEKRAWLTPNTMGRYAIGDRTRGLQFDSDGSLVIAMAHETQWDTLPANALPTPEGQFILCLRAYEPGPALLSGAYRLPAITRIEA